MLGNLFEEGLMFIFLKYSGEKEFIDQIYYVTILCGIT